MNRLPLILLISIAISILTACLSPEHVKFESKVREWVPLGTDASDAQRTMERHGFECHLITTNNVFNSRGFDYLDCEMIQVMFHDWNARLILQDGKVSAYGLIRAN
ncbi:MAG: hypothetical protein ABI651_02950 [Verrucomicrobiota bacterium]